MPLASGAGRWALTPFFARLTITVPRPIRRSVARQEIVTGARRAIGLRTVIQSCGCPQIFGSQDSGGAPLVPVMGS
jgi:hypothetical protein